MTDFHDQRMFTMLSDPKRVPLAVEARLIFADVIDFMCRCGISLEIDAEMGRIGCWINDHSSEIDCSDIAAMARRFGSGFSKTAWKRLKSKPPLYDALRTLTNARSDWPLSKLNSAAGDLAAMMQDEANGNQDLLNSVMSLRQGGLMIDILAAIGEREDGRVVRVADASHGDGDVSGGYSHLACSMLWGMLHVDVETPMIVTVDELAEMEEDEREERDDQAVAFEVQRLLRKEFAALNGATESDVGLDEPTEPEDGDEGQKIC